MRTHINMPARLIEEVDELVGPRRRSQFVAEAVAEKVEQLNLLRAARAAMGSMEHVETPGWETSESTAAWVRSLRRADTARDATLDQLQAEPDPE